MGAGLRWERRAAVLRFRKLFTCVFKLVVGYLKSYMYICM